MSVVGHWLMVSVAYRWWCVVGVLAVGVGVRFMVAGCWLSDEVC